MSGYPLLDADGRQRRTPYEDNVFRNLDRANDPYGYQARDTFTRRRLDEERFGSQRRRQDPLRPLITITNPVEQRRRSLPEFERSGSYPAFMRECATPPPRRSRDRISGFQEMFGGYDRPEGVYGGGNERLFTDAQGPSNYFSRSGSRLRDEQPRRREDAYRGFGEPRNPFAPGGDRYDRLFSSRAPGRHPDSRFNDEDRRRREYQRGQIGEDWGLAEWQAAEFLGIQIDAVYHTSLVFEGIEYFFGGGVQTCYAGKTHHGRPMEIIPMGTTHLPMEDILEYLESLKQIYTAESYDLFAHNCNNFTNDFAMFLVGKGIPDHITSLPKRVLDTPFGQMLKPQIDASMRSVTQAPVPAQNVPSSSANKPSQPTPAVSAAHGKPGTRSAPILLGNKKPVTYGKVPPLEKLVAKLGNSGKDAALLSLKTFIQKRDVDPREAALPDLEAVGRTLQTTVLNLPVEVRFAAVDLLRCAMIDPRVSGFFAEEQGTQTVPTLISHVNELKDCPHNLRLVTIHLACNLFTSHLYIKTILQPDSEIATQLIQLITSSLLDVSHPTTRVAASWLAFNVAGAAPASCTNIGDGSSGLAESLQVELAASLIEVLGSEDNPEAVKAQLLALGYLLYCAPAGGEVMDVAKALDAKATVDAVSGSAGNGPLAKEVASLLP
ncbi:hypothetical protein LTR85_008707 [Meristemomyces frigidus]|nr:hypothetical protein LTR85_008707 [Meristemomyces frigidus]